MSNLQNTLTTPAAEPFALSESQHALERALRAADPDAFPVPPRIVRRAVRDELDLPRLARVPHRKSFVLSAARARQILSHDELGLDDAAPLPPVLILLARPEEHDLETMTPEALREHYRRLHFHARVHVALEARRAAGALDDTAIQSRIDDIGHTAFDEIRSVLQHEAFLLSGASAAAVYIEFAAVFLELRHFAPDILGVYFPALDDLLRIESLLAEDVDAERLLDMTSRLPSDLPGDSAEAPETGLAGYDENGVMMSAPVRKRIGRRAAAAAARGNDVRAAILHTRLTTSRSRRTSTEARALADADVDRLVSRLSDALAIPAKDHADWRMLLHALLENAARGFWRPDARLLYDLQKVCLDSEQVTYVVDLGAYLRSFGRRPLKRPLPAQREVLMSKHLRLAMSRVKRTRLGPGQREQLSAALEAAASSAEARLRERLREPVRQTLSDVGFVPHNVPERVAFAKITEELLDAIVERGFLTMGDIRDAIARNNLKLDDVSDPKELLYGDRLLRADERLADVLDGVYQRGAFYLRWLQRLSSLAFGTRAGRFFTLYVAIPFGGAYVVLAGLDHLIHAVEAFVLPDVEGSARGLDLREVPEPHAAHLANVYMTLLVGIVFLGLIHDKRVRSAARWLLVQLGRGLKALFIDLPLRIARFEAVQKLLRSPPVVFVRKRLLTAMLITAFFCWVLPAIGWYRPPTLLLWIAVFAILAAALNSRAGRDIEELTAEGLQSTWHRVRVHVFVALFYLIMDTFERVLEWVERVLYEVDEWLRFRSGETVLTLSIKAVLGLVWSIVRFVVRFFVTVLFEPQINPVKHFPVVTVSHKIILPLGIPLSRSLAPLLGAGWANMVAGTTVFLVPGVFGFLVWELRGNWMLYAANRHKSLQPMPIGHHGESMVRLLRPGLHSGTVPRLFSRLRRAARKAHPATRARDLMAYYGKLRHVEEDVRRFFEREFAQYIEESAAFHGASAQIGEVTAATNRLRVQVMLAQFGREPLRIEFRHRAGHIIGTVDEPEWVGTLTPDQRTVLDGLLLGLFRLSGADEYRVADTGRTIVLRDSRTPWNEWVAAWGFEQSGHGFRIAAPVPAAAMA